MTKKTASHNNGFFARPPHDWSIIDFVKYIFKREQSDTVERSNRLILNSWIRSLTKISSCSNSRCCNKKRRSRADELRNAYHKEGSGSDKSTAIDVLKLLRDETTTPPPPVTVNVESLDLQVNNHSVVNNGSSSHGDINHASTNTFPLDTSDNPSPRRDGSPPVRKQTNSSHPSLLDQLASFSAQQQNSDKVEADHDLDDGVSESSYRDQEDVAFEEAYEAMQTDSKWRLPSGNYIEDILHAAYDKDSPNFLTVRNWILDVTDQSIEAFFTPEDWAAIRKEIPPLPKLDERFLESLRRFDRITTTEQLRKVLATTTYSVEDAEKADFDVEWAERVIWHFLSLYESSSLTPSKCLERWYDCNVWSRVIDDCLRSIPHVLLDRCESTSHAYLLRKNRHRNDPSSRVKPGPRFDGILRNYPHRNLEFCVIESAPDLRGGVISTKWLSDKQKIKRALRDMISLLDSEANLQRRRSSRVLEGKEEEEPLQVVGISTAGLIMQVSRMVRKRGYVCLFVVSKEVRIPREVGQLRELLVVLAGFVKVKRLIANTTALFHKRGSNTNGDDGSADDEGESLLKELETAFDDDSYTSTTTSTNPTTRSTGNSKTNVALPSIADTP